MGTHPIFESDFDCLTEFNFKMPLSLFIGAGGVSLAPLISMFVIFIAPSHVRIIFWICGAFFWLLSLLGTAILWNIWYACTKSNDQLNNDLKFGAIIGVFIQEVVRVLGLYGLRKVINLMETRGRQSPESLAMSGSSGYFVAGLGFGSLATLFHMMNVLAASLGPGSPGLPDGSNQNLYFTSAFFASALTLNHAAWSVISGVAIEMGLDSKKSKLMIFYVTVAHLLCTGTSLMNNEGYIWPAMTTAWISVAASGIVALRESGLKRPYQLVDQWSSSSDDEHQHSTTCATSKSPKSTKC